MNFNIEANRSIIKTASQYNFSTTTNNGSRYRLAGGIAYDKSLRGFGHVGFENRYLQGSFQLNTDNKLFNYSAQIGGSLGCIAGTCFISKPVENGFALVQVPGRKNITISKETGGILGQTDRRGNLVITDLKPYQQVKIHAITRDLDPVGLVLNS